MVVLALVLLALVLLPELDARVRRRVSPKLRLPRARRMHSMSGGATMAALSHSRGSRMGASLTEYKTLAAHAALGRGVSRWWSAHSQCRSLTARECAAFHLPHSMLLQ